MTYLAECYEKLGDLTSAKRHYLGAMELAPEYAEPWYGMGIIEMNCGRFEESMNYLKTGSQKR